MKTEEEIREEIADWEEIKEESLECGYVNVHTTAKQVVDQLKWVLDE